ncbi:MAG: DUF4402 domain-containing protein [Balneolaceae bacterium]
MINRSTKVLLILLGAILPQSLFAQFINLQITIEPELSVEVERALDFGQVISNSGIKEINIGDINTGIFSIRAIRSQSLYFELTYPDALFMVDNRIDNIPLKLQTSYNNSGDINISNAQILSNNSGIINVGGTTNNSGALWRKLYLYVYGSIDVGNIPNGVYSGTIVLYIDYD